MASKSILIHYNFEGNEIQNVSLQKLITNPTGVNLKDGMLWANVDTGLIHYYDNTDDTGVLRDTVRTLLWASGLFNGQTLYGGTEANGSLTLASTSNAIKGSIKIPEFNSAGFVKNAADGTITGGHALQASDIPALSYEPTLTKGDLTESSSSVLTITGGTGAVIGSGTTIQVKQATTSQSGYLTSTDWTTFNSKIDMTSGTTAGYIPTWVNGKTLGTGYSVETTLTGSSGAIPRADAVKSYIDQFLTSADALVYKGVIDASTNPYYPDASLGDVYKISVAGKIGGASGPNVEVGDMIICNVDTDFGTHATVGANWSIIQTNIDGAVTGPATAVTNTNFVSWNGTNGRVVADSGYSASSFMLANVLTTKGDILVYSTTPTRLGIGTNDYVLIADSTQATGMKWAQLSLSNTSGTLPATRGGTGLTTTTVGDLFYGTASNTITALSGNTTTTIKMLTQTGTGSASAAPVWTSFVYESAIGDGTNSEYVITHNLNSRGVKISVWRTTSPYDEIDYYAEKTSTNSVTLRFNRVLTSNEFTVSISI